MKLLMRPREQKSTFSCSRLLKQMLKHFLRSREEPKRKKIKTIRLLSINAKRIRLNLRPNKKPKEREKRKSVKFRDSVSFRRRLLIDRLKLMLLGLRERLRREKDKPEKEKSSKPPRE